MLIEIPRTLLVREPWTTLTTGGAPRIRPLIVAVPSESTDGASIEQQVTTSPEHTNTFRIVDVDGPCYEFEGKAALQNNVMTVHVAGSLRFLR